MMIYVTGDTHRMQDFAKLPAFSKEHPELTRADMVIVAGDFGGVWSAHTLREDLKPYEELPFTVAFVDGNHENFDLLEKYPVETLFGGKIHRIADNVLHLMRGQVYKIAGKTFFTFGGAESVDKAMRTEKISWWRQEMPTDADVVEANKNLGKVGFKVDYIVTHTCDERALYYPPLSMRRSKIGVLPENRLLSYFEENVEYGHWYFGHYHLDGELNGKKTVLFHNIIRIC